MVSLLLLCIITRCLYRCYSTINTYSIVSFHCHWYNPRRRETEAGESTNKLAVRDAFMVCRTLTGSASKLLSLCLRGLHSCYWGSSRLTRHLPWLARARRNRAKSPLPRTPLAPLLGTRYCLPRSSLLLPSLPQPSLVCLATLSPALATLTRGAALTTRSPLTRPLSELAFRHATDRGADAAVNEPLCSFLFLPLTLLPLFTHFLSIYFFSLFLHLFIYYFNVFIFLSPR